MLPKTLSIFEGITDAAWGSAVEISSTPGVYVMKEFPHEKVDGHSRASLFTTLIGKARTERALGRRVAAAESLGMAATLLPPEFVSRLPVCNPKIDADALSSLPDACPDLSPESLPRSFPVEDLVDFFEAKSEM
uniref:Uncharacterized protein n=1 Tax=Chromera velia CCMP2878 TaxID=1169474 RepID=A0A0G4FAZ3_9ALVE|eukprot:Cvel_16078.t1-p1 / transcript=Cvel_16078.t1 / gene=Cvel_16078 / organism=Chromera_velia_CCMP2878 / gene_product=hypothetical protein / transcript_product=hypothetical protein / location=Cvel_scaffold1222:14823-15221(+) / protein_length=133 / sequence_SO=supercontig / SO=protein_coding / is_pseudo=false